MEALHRVVKMTVKTGCDLSRVVMTKPLPKPKAEQAKAKLDREADKADFNGQEIVSYIMEPCA